jgi:4-carboxymuconolactone decarboxylase
MTEPRFKELSLADMNPEQRRVAEKILAGPRKGLRGPFQALLRSPELGDLVQQVGEHVRFKSVLPNPVKEMAIMMTARHWTAQFEWYAHREIGEKEGLSPALCDAIAAGRRPDKMSGDETLVYEFASELLGTGEVSDKSFAGMRERWGERGVVELTCTLGYYSTVAMILNVHRHPVPPDAKPLAPLKR